MQQTLEQCKGNLAKILAHFWDGTVAWTPQADRQLRFWLNINFLQLQSPISADVLGKLADTTVEYPQCADPASVSFLFQDASATATGGGVLRCRHRSLVPDHRLFLALFSSEQQAYSSTLREILGILWCLKATGKSSKKRIIFLCDNWQTCEAIKYGSRIPLIQAAAEEIFAWCIQHGKLCWPVWLPRTHRLIKEADRRSRLTIPHDYR